MAPEPVEIDRAQLDRWQQMRDAAQARYNDLLDDAPSDDVLDRLAWVAGTMSDIRYPFHNMMRLAIEDARQQRRTWREIAGALGEDPDAATAKNVAAKQYWRNQQYSQIEAERQAESENE